ncbi:hypothetical protein EJ04DRAFT_549959 [Polyplosphaeria fusca]|uniref:Rhodopsin domain-containing protein n=1 Tax=Polyplosphaeria fusca TaxID=682080 RepID=A0A9P4R861_9PLEO|nr:hypothetical protein EJ04DRAFT_549959 [Polyplosphaeria fusca]
MRAIPIEVILSWPAPNYTDPVTRGNALIIVNAIFISLVIIVVTLRLYTRMFIKRWFGSDDICIILALITTVGLTVTVLLANVSYGWNRHVYDIPFNKIEPTLKIAMAAKLLFTVASTFTRLSLLFFYYRLITDAGKDFFKWVLHASVTFVALIGIGFFFLGIFLCNPVSDYWNFAAPADTCIDEGKATLGVGVANCFADALCTVLPIPMISRLQLPPRQRIAVIILFSLGFIVTIAGAVRTYYIYQSLIAHYDVTWYAFPLWIAAAVEIDLGVICASAPVLRPLLSKIPPRISSVSSKITSKFSTSSKTPQQDTEASGTTLQGSHASQSKTSANCPRPRPERLDEYELRQWEDVERGVHHNDGSHSEGSQEAILGSDEGASKRGSWRRRMRNQEAIMSNSDEGRKGDSSKKRTPITDMAGPAVLPSPPPPTTTMTPLELEELQLPFSRVSTKSSDAVGTNNRVSIATIGSAK